MEEIEALLGVRPVEGGQHPNFGTHNAVVSLGDAVYLEILAPDPELPAPARGRLFQDRFSRPSGLANWVLRTDAIEDLYTKVVAQGLGLGRVEKGERVKPDGTVLSWYLTDPYPLPFDGAIPFLISWGNSPHPAASAPDAGKLTRMQINHPHPEAVLKYLDLLDVGIIVEKSLTFNLIAEIETPQGKVLLK